ncbi:S8 family serine peptidase [Adhaeribacter radiodurans]|uniref:S8 family serine peptidase n=1 Tax=Adhaeribacter radiodurans TaxID=2745197 RepID=A0A7L7L9T3_9BACT|nr:S8 family serine peptidase [Adhaeribacter radiodurans]QMU29497.1 S8 family serine peptidase [Adhaeribacter radiodurans]
MAPGQALQKIGPELATLLNQATTNNKGTGATAISRFPVNKSLLQIKNNQVVIQALAESNTEQLLTDLKKLGLTHPASYGRMVSGLIPIAALDKVAKLKSMRSARPAYKPATRIGKATTQGDRAVYADSARKQQVVTGKGSKVGLISDSYNSIGEADKGIKSGDLPGKNNPNGFTTSVQVLLDEAPGWGTDEGRAMAEVVHDVAPGAELAFYSADFGQASFAQGIIDLQQVGCNVIVDDILYFDEPMFQDGIVAQAIDEVKKNGTSYFTAAGNQGRDSYQAAYKPGGVAYFGSKSFLGPQKARNAHNFAPAGKKKDVTQRIFIPVGASFIISFQYSEPFYSVGNGSSKGAQSDLDIYLLTEDTTDVVSSGTYANINNDPVEVFSFFNDGSYDSNYFNILIDKFEGASPSIIKYVLFRAPTDEISIKEYNTNSSTIYGHNNAAGAITTGAVFFLDTPAYGIEDPVAESFSSAGGTPLVYDENGKPRSRIVRRKPEIMAPDGGSNTFFGEAYLDEFYFFGTSAAAPHAAAVAALMQEANGNNLSPDKVKTTLEQTAQNMNDPGFDFETGYGLINAQKALERVSTPRVREFNLVDADSRKTIKRLQEGDIINLTRLPTRNVFIYVRTGPTHVGSVLFDVNGDKKTESKAPYNYPGSTDDYFKITEGNYTITAVPYTQANGKGTAGVPLTLNFRVVEEKIIRFELFDINNGSVVQELKEGDELNLATLPTHLNIRAVTNPVRVGSVQFTLNNKTTIENLNTYDLAGSSGKSIDFKPGTYTLSASIYPYEMARGMVGGSKTITFKVTDRATKNDNSKEQLTVYPNPFPQKTKLQFSVPETGNTTLTIYDLNGRPVVILHNGEAIAGKQYEYVLDGSSLPGGWYISRLVTSKNTYHQKLRLTK